jgi:hypothetical protein
MKAFDFIQTTISHNLKDPHSKALESDCLFPLLAVATQSLKGEESFLENWMPRSSAAGYFTETL